MKYIQKSTIYVLVLTIILYGILFICLNKNFVKAESNLSVSYSSHIENVGWEANFSHKNGEISGTVGESKRVEAIKIKLTGDTNAVVKYQTHVQDIGWMDWKKNGEIAGTTGESKRIEAIKIKLENVDNYYITYRVHVQDIGWMDWKKNGEIAGTTGQSKRIEAIEIKLVKIGVSYQTHIQDIGWQGEKTDSELAGTTGESKRIEAIKVKLTGFPTNVSVLYRTHVEEIGWQDWVEDGKIAGTTGESKRIEAIEIKLKDTSDYSIKYQVHVQDVGWQDWVEDGKVAGTTGQSKRIEAIRIKIVQKNSTTDTNKDDNDSTEKKDDETEEKKEEKPKTANSIETITKLDENKYPGYKEKLLEIAKKHPKWDITFLKTGLKFSDVINGEYALRSRNLVPKSYGGEWICGTEQYDTGWYGASSKAIAYYMDPRNFLDDSGLFQFLDVNGYEGCSLTGIQSKTKNTWLADYAKDVNNACKNKDVNAYYIIARLLQEQGTKGGSTIKMQDDTNPNVYYYNPFNIGASGNGVATVIANAKAKAKSYGWDTMEKALEGGIDFCKKNWLDNHQNTLYQNKFDIYVDSSSLYSHQYMQNLMAAYSEALILRSSYTNTNTIDSYLTFIVPLYEEMSKTVSEIPSNNTETYAMNVTTTGTDINIRADANTDSKIIGTIKEKGTRLLSIKRGVNSDWNWIITDDGIIGYVTGKYLKQVDDYKPCNYKAYIKTNDGDGCYVRIGPSTSFDRITAYADGTIMTVIDDSTYKNISGYDWSRVILTNGTQAFIPSKFLTK